MTGTPRRSGHQISDRFVPRRPLRLGVVAARPLVAVVADDEISDATVLISVYEPDQDHGWTPGAIRAILEGDGREEGP